MKLGWCAGYGKNHAGCRRSIVVKGETRHCQCEYDKCPCSKNPREEGVQTESSDV